MKLLYIAGPFSAPTPGEIEANIDAAEAYALVAWKRGWAVICPHKNSAGFETVAEIPDSVWYRGYLEMVSRCDAVLLIPGWQDSLGAMAEKTEAERHGIRVFVYDQVGIPSPEEAIR